MAAATAAIPHRMGRPDEGGGEVNLRRGGDEEGGGGGGVKCEVPRTRCSTGVRLSVVRRWGCLFGVRFSCMSFRPIGVL